MASSEHGRSGIPTDPGGKFRRRNRPVRILIDTFLSVCITIALTSGVWLLELGGQGAAMAAMFVPLLFLWGLFYLGIAAVLLYGLISSRLGFLLGPILLAAGLFTASVEMRRQHEVLIAGVPTSGVEPAHQSHKVIAHSGSPYCMGYCQKVLATTPHVFAVRDDSAKAWVTFRRGEGDECMMKDNVRSTLVFLETGYACVIRESVPEIDDALEFRVRIVGRDESIAAWQIPFSGHVIEISERTAGEQRLLARRLVGLLGTPLPWVFTGFSTGGKDVDLGPPIDERKFFAEVLGVPVEQLGAPGGRGQ